MKSALLLARREIASYLRSPLGYLVVAAALLIEGLWFYTRGLGEGAKLSAEVLQVFFDVTAGVTTIISVLLSMRLIAGERENNTLVLLNTAPVRETEIVFGKFLGGFAFLAMTTFLSAYMPLLVYVNGKVATGHVLVGYLGILLLAAATLSVGIFASAVAKNQVIAAILGAVILGVFFLLFFVARNADAPLKEFLSGLSLFQFRQTSFMKGVVKLENVVFNVAVSYFFLLAATKTLEARRWR